jgi:hypothetical protein
MYLVILIIQPLLTINHQSLATINNWLVVSTPLKNMKVSWDYEIPNRWKNKIHGPNHQPALLIHDDQVLSHCIPLMV